MTCLGGLIRAYPCNPWPNKMLTVKNLEVCYGAISALRDVSFHIDAGRIVTLIGANGAGKTTTLRTISGLLRAKKGGITFKGEDITKLPPHQIVARGLCHVPEGRMVFSNLTVDENLRLGACTRRDKAQVEADFERVFGYFPRLRERRRQQAGTLSGGEQQMLAVSRALMLRPRLMLLDEPSFGLAPRIVAGLFEILREINRSDGVSMLLVEQNAALALKLADDAYLLETGRVVMAGPDPDDPTIGHLARLYVAPERWAEGIGRQLYAAAVASLVDAGFPAATLWVLERNTRARTWYERLGWRLTGDRKPTYAPAGIDDVGYRIDLAGPADRP